MIKCYFVDVKSISSTVSKSKFKKAEIDRLADAILAADGLLRPLILQETGVEKYTVIEGHREYYAAVRAKEKDIKKAETVNAFIIDANLRKSAIEQLNLLIPQPASESPAPDLEPNILTDLIAASIDRLLPEITAAISIQLQPIVSQLIEHQQILETIKVATSNESAPNNKESTEAEKVTSKRDSQSVTKTKTTSNSKQTAKLKDLELPTSAIAEPPVETVLPKTQPETVPRATTRNSNKPKPEAKPSLPTPVVAVTPAKQPVTTAASIKKTNANETKTGTVIVDSIDSDKSTNALNLINTLNQSDLTLRLERSGVAKAIIKSVPIIISKRDSQPSQKFETWEDIIDAKITGLTASKIPDIIKKLK